MLLKKQGLQFLSITVFLISQLIQAQDFQLKGKLIDNDNIPLESATVYLEKEKDSTMVIYTITDANVVSLNLFISYTEFNTYKKEISMNPTSNLTPLSSIIYENEIFRIIFFRLIEKRWLIVS